MRYGPDDEFWVVLDPTPESEMVDILFSTSLRTLRLQFLGGLSMEQNPTIFTDEREATLDAERRLTSLRGGQTGPRPEAPSGAGSGSTLTTATAPPAACQRPTVVDPRHGFGAGRPPAPTARPETGTARRSRG